MTSDSGLSLTTALRCPGLSDPRLQVACGDGLSPDDLSQLAGHDAVLSIVAAPDLKQTTVAEQVTRNLVRAMNDSQVSRLAVVSREVGDVQSRTGRDQAEAGSTFIRMLLRHSYADARNMESVPRRPPPRRAARTPLREHIG